MNKYSKAIFNVSRNRCGFYLADNIDHYISYLIIRQLYLFIFISELSTPK
ncbi:protein of unknown function [Latilactobacillus sakei]|nr:protein of unknown function [Latilactobacillus sakei]